jgi:hypothetical protein
MGNLSSGIGTVLSMCMLATIGVSMSACSDDPSDVLSDLVSAAEVGDWGVVYDSLDSSSRDELEPWLARMVVRNGSDTEQSGEQARRTGRELFIHALETTEGLGAMLFLHGEFSVGEAVVDGELATVIEENGKWKLKGDRAVPLGLPMSPPDDY